MNEKLKKRKKGFFIFSLFKIWSKGIRKKKEAKNRPILGKEKEYKIAAAITDMPIFNFSQILLW